MEEVMKLNIEDKKEIKPLNKAQTLLAQTTKERKTILEHLDCT